MTGWLGLLRPVSKTASGEIGQNMVAMWAAGHSNNFQKGRPAAERSVGKLVAAQVLCNLQRGGQERKRSIFADLTFGSLWQDKEQRG